MHESQNLQESLGKSKVLSEEEKWLIAVEAARLVGFGTVHRPLRFRGDFPGVEKSLKIIAETGSNRRSCLICGPVGVGKTALLSAMFKCHVLAWYNAMEMHQPPYHVPVLVAMRSMFVTHEDVIKAAHAEIGEGPVDLSMEQLATIQVLMIDDLGDTTESDYHQVKLDTLIDARWRMGLTTWITSNLSVGDIERRSGWERIASRLADKNWMTQFELPGKDLRKEAQRPGTAKK